MPQGRESAEQLRLSGIRVASKSQKQEGFCIEHSQKVVVVLGTSGGIDAAKGFVLFCEFTEERGRRP